MANVNIDSVVSADVVIKLWFINKPTDSDASASWLNWSFSVHYQKKTSFALEVYICYKAVM